MIDRAAVPFGEHSYQGGRYGLCTYRGDDGLSCLMPETVHPPRCGRCDHDYDNHDLTHGICIGGLCDCPAYRAMAVRQ